MFGLAKRLRCRLLLPGPQASQSVLTALPFAPVTCTVVYKGITSCSARCCVRVLFPCSLLPIHSTFLLPPPYPLSHGRQISPHRVRLNSPVSMVQWSTAEEMFNPPADGVDGASTGRAISVSRAPSNPERGGNGRVPDQQAAAAAAVQTDAYTRNPCVVEYKNRRECEADDVKAGGGGIINRRIRCRRVLVTVGLGVLKVRTYIVTAVCSTMGYSRSTAYLCVIRTEYRACSCLVELF